MKEKSDLYRSYICIVDAIKVRVDILLTFEPEKFNLYSLTWENFDWLVTKYATKSSFTPYSLQLEK